ncbi:hypothetical protein ADUPG1_007275 [Aduncisulcus paluster]|uniref:Uncharacterized protein n=1 Tax=Aduncisulcus paluster TaxID=2918883 RepID=A0ABQ5KLF6_9EUKA|nr:hypothetical protein ADUPG1_007275 [Aduncisulcus paluster]
MTPQSEAEIHRVSSESPIVRHFPLDPIVALPLIKPDYDPSIRGVLVDLTLKRYISMSLYRLLYTRSPSSLNLITPYNLLQIRKRQALTMKSIIFRENTYYYTPLSSFLYRVLNEKSFFSLLTFSSPFKPNSSKEGEVTAGSKFVEMLALFRKEYDISTVLPRRMSFHSLQDFIQKHKSFGVEPILFISILAFQDGVATCKKGNTALSLKVSVCNICLEERGKHCWWEELALLPEEKGASAVMLGILESEIDQLRKGIWVYGDDGRVLVVGDLQMITADHPERAKIVGTKTNRCQWCNISGPSLLFALPGSSRQHDPFSIRSLSNICPDPLHVFYLGIVEMYQRVIFTILTPKGRERVDNIMKRFGVKVSLSGFYTSAMELRDFLKHLPIALFGTSGFLSGRSRFLLERDRDLSALPPLEAPIRQTRRDEWAHAWVDSILHIRWCDVLAAIGLTNTYMTWALYCTNKKDALLNVRWIQLTRLVMVPLSVHCGKVSVTVPRKVKLHVMCHLPEMIDRHGKLLNGDTQTGERLNKTLLRSVRNLRCVRSRITEASYTLPYISGETRLSSNRITVRFKYWILENDDILFPESLADEVATGKRFTFIERKKISSPIIGDINLFAIYQHEDTSSAHFDDLLEEVSAIEGKEIDSEFDGKLIVCL